MKIVYFFVKYCFSGLQNIVFKNVNSFLNFYFNNVRLSLNRSPTIHINIMLIQYNVCTAFGRYSLKSVCYAYYCYLIECDWATTDQQPVCDVHTFTRL